MNKNVFEDELISGMQKELRKQASAEEPNLVKAAECLHAALEIFEEAGMQSKADQVLQVLEKIADGQVYVKQAVQITSLDQLMQAGVTTRDLKEFARGSEVATAKLNLVLRALDQSDHDITKLMGPGNLMSEEKAKKLLNTNNAGSILDFQKSPSQAPGPDGSDQFSSLAQDVLDAKKHKTPSDKHTKGLTPDKEIENLKHHGTVFNMADDGAADLLDADVKEDTLEVFDKDIPLADFEDERN
jgi:hypothetical protein